MRALVTGATGFIGRALLARLATEPSTTAAVRPVVLSRDAQRAANALAALDVATHAWDPMAGTPPVEAFAGVDVVFHLAGEPVAGRRWNNQRRRRVRDSRVVGTRNLVATLLELPSPRPTLISASAVGFYGDRGDEMLNERSAPGDDFLAEVCRDWEAEALRAAGGGMRVALPRIGIVVGAGGGALAKMRTPFRLGLGSPLGSGRQWMPWIHLDDLVESLLLAAENTSLAGPFNATAPEPATNRDFTRALARALHRPAVLPAVPRLALRLLVGGFADVLLSSQRAVPTALLKAGFSFRYPMIDAALAAVYS